MSATGPSGGRICRSRARPAQISAGLADLGLANPGLVDLGLANPGLADRDLAVTPRDRTARRRGGLDQGQPARPIQLTSRWLVTPGW